MQNSVLVILLRTNKNTHIKEICLGLKINGFAEGMWNGFGGKIEEGETPKQAAVREVEEETSLVIEKEKLQKVAEVLYYEPQGDWKTHVYLYDNSLDEPIETYEMRPQWFNVADIPYEDMWENDALWLPKVLAGKKIKGSVWNDAEGNVKKHDFSEVSSFKKEDF